MKTKWYKLEKKELSIYLKLVIASLFYILPIALANVYYNDDMARTLYGATGWNGDGRPLCELLIKLLCGGAPVVDIAPLPLILSVLILSYALVLYAGAYLDFVPNENIVVIILLSVLANPFAIANLSYRFDCISMFTALSIPFLIFSVPDRVSGIKMFVCSFVAGIAVMSLYQPAIGMCIVLFIIHLFFVVMNDRKAGAGWWKICGLGTGTVFYKLVIAPRFIDPYSWRNEASATVGINFDSIKTLILNAVNSIKYIRNYIVQTSILNQICLGIIIVLSVVTILVLYFRSSEKSGWRKAVDAAFMIVSPLVAFSAAFLPLAFLENQILASRMLLAFGGFLLYLGIMLIYANRKRLFVAVLLVVCLAHQYTYIYSYGNALKTQNEYEKYMVYSIAHDLETINGKGEYSQVSFVGQMPKARELQMMCEKYPFLDEVVPVYFSNDTWIGGAWVYHYMQYDLTIVEEDESDTAVMEEDAPVVENAIYSCYLNSDKIIVSFH